VLRGLLAPTTSRAVNIVNADGVAADAGVTVTEVVAPPVSNGTPAAVPGTITVGLSGAPSVEGRLERGAPTLTRVDGYEPALRLTGAVLLYVAVDAPGQLGAVGTYLGGRDVNLRYLCVSPGGVGGVALVAVGVDGTPPADVVEGVGRLVGEPIMAPMLVEFGP